ncbi:MAG: ribonuclease P protein component [Capnocytophaga sp.]|nr:ribonuclease P protein component [Capnocytophaga sp.]
MQNNTFPKREKLCSYSDIQQLFSEGKSIKNFPLKLLFFPIEKEITQVLISVPKRNLKKSVQRNRVKRLIRESYRLQKSLFLNEKGTFALAFIYIGKEICSFSQIMETMKQLGEEWNKTLQNNEITE